MAETKHTPLEIVIPHKAPDTLLIMKEGKCVWLFDKEEKETAELIVKAVNSHEKLVEALEEATKELEHIRINNWLGHGRENEVKGYISKYRQLLKQAKQ